MILVESFATSKNDLFLLMFYLHGQSIIGVYS